MKQTVRRVSCFLLSLILAAGLAEPLSVSAAAQTGTFTLSSFYQFPKRLLLTQNQLTVEEIPAGNDFASIWLVLTDQAGNTVYNNIVSRNGQNQAVFPLDTLSPGTYAISLFHGAGSQDYLFLLDGISFQLGAAAGAFIKPAKTMAMNSSASDTPQNSKAAQSYFLRSTEESQSDHPQIIAQSKAITGSLTDAYAKALAIHDWVSSTLYYDFDAFRGRTDYGEQDAVSVLNSKLAVCAGYSNLTVALLRAAGIPARKVRGYALGINDDKGQFPEEVLKGEKLINHAWVEAYANGRWLIMDPTWDCGNDWEYGKASKSDGCNSHRYFDIAPEFFAADHAAIIKNQYQEMYLYMDNPQYRTGQTWKACGGHNAAPTVLNGTVMAPIITILKEMGGEYHWDTTSNPGWSGLLWYAGEHQVEMWLKNKTFYVEGRKYHFDVAPQMVNGATMVQVRPLMEAMGHEILWEGKGADRHLTIRYSR